MKKIKRAIQKFKEWNWKQTFLFQVWARIRITILKPQDIETQWNEIISEGAFFSFSCFSCTLAQLNDHQIKSTTMI